MAYATATLQATTIVTATGYLIKPEPFHSLGSAAIERSEPYRQAVTEAARRNARAAIEAGRQNAWAARRRARRAAVDVANSRPVKWYAGPSAVARVEEWWPVEEEVAQAPEVEEGVDAVEPEEIEGARAPEPDAQPEIPASRANEPEYLFGANPQPAELPTLRGDELDEILTSIHQRRKLRHEETVRQVQGYRTSIPPPVASSEKRSDEGKKTVRFTLDTKPGSVEVTPSKPEDQPSSPIAPPPSTELDYFSTCIAGPEGSLFAHPTKEFNEADLIRKLPSQMKNGGGGLAWCRGRTEQGLYMLDTPMKRLLLDLRAGVCYDGGNGRKLTVEEAFICMLWGRGSVEEKWGGIRWKRGLQEGEKK